MEIAILLTSDRIIQYFNKLKFYTYSANQNAMGIRLTNRAILLLFSFIFFHAGINAQPKAFYQKSIPLSFSFGQPGNSNPENLFFSSLAKNLSHGDQPVTIQFKQQVKLFRKESTVSVNLEWSEFSFNCDTAYKGMNLKNEMLPSKMICNVFVLNKKTKSSYPFTYLSHPPAGGKISFIAGTLKEKIKGDYQVDVKDVRPVYTAEQVTALENRIRMIDYYYASGKELEKIIPALKTMKLTDMENFAEQRKKLSQADSVLEMLEEISFSFSLELEKNDPAGVIPRFKTLKELCAARHTELNHIMTELPYQYYLSGLKSAKLGRSAEAKKYFNMSLAVDPAYSPSLLQLALSDKAAGRMTDAEDKAKTILLSQKPDSATAAAARSIIDQKLQRMIGRISDLLHYGKEDDALLKVAEAKAFLNEVPMLNRDRIDNLEMQCYRSCYARMLTNSRAFYAQNLFAKSEKLLRDAVKYQGAHHEFIADAGEAENLLRNVLIRQYNQLVQKGKTELFNKHFDKALTAFDDAIDYQVRNKLTANEDAQALKLRAARSVISDIINKALAASEAKRMGEAKKIAMKALDTARDRDLMNDSDLSPKLKLLRETVFNKECLMAQSNYNEWHKTGKLAESQKDFLGAHLIYSRAQNYFNDYRECSLDAENIEQDQLAIDPAFIYQSMLLEVRVLEDKMNYASAVYKYKEAGKYFSDQRINSFGLQHQHLADFALDNCSDAFLNYLAKYFVEKGEADKSFALYKSLIERKYYVKHSLYNGLNNLGAFIGWRDHLASRSGKPKLLARDYFLGEETSNSSERQLDELKRIYKPFVQGFVRGWKKVR